MAKSAKRDLKKKVKKEFQHGLIFSAVLFLYIGLLLGSVYYSVTPETMLDATREVPTMLDVFTNLVPHITESPLNLVKVFPTNFLYVVFSMMVWIMYALYSYSIFIRKYNTMYEDAYGSGGFNEDLSEFYRKYVCDPAIVGGKTVKDDEGKKVTNKQIPVGDMKMIAHRNVLSKEKLEECLTNSQIYSQEVYLSLNCQWTRRNLNAFYLGASGTGKSRFAVKPNLIQANSSFVVTDPSGENVEDCGGFLESQGYQIKVLNLKDLSQSNRYNPMAYIKKSSDIPVLINCLIANLEGKKGSGGGGNDKFWKDSTLALLSACTAYLFEVFNDDNEFLEDGKTPNPYYKGKRNFVNVMRMLRMLDIHEDEGESISDLDRLFAELAEKDPRSYAVSMYRTFKMAPSKTALNIVISTAVQIGTFFDNHEFANIAYKDEMDIESIGKRKTAVFLITPEGETTYNFFAAMFYTQLFQVLYAEGEENRRRKGSGDPALEVPVRIFLDEMANIGQIPQFNEKLSTMRKYRISAVPIFQSLAQLKTCFKDDWEVVIGNCDTMVFLGGAEPSECEMLSKRLGKMSVKTFSYGKSYGGKGGSSDNMQQIGREVLTTDEIERMKNNEQLVFIRGERPFCTPKYSYENHPNYKYTAGSGCKEALRFDIERLQTTVDYNEMEATYLYAYGVEEHVEPRENEDCKGKPLAVDNFSVQLDERTSTLSKGKIKSWKDTVKKTQKEEQKKQPFIVPSEEEVANLRPLNDADKASVEKKLEDITGKKYTNISEVQFKQLINISDNATPEQVTEWCAAHLQLSGGFSPGYEFSEENDFLISDDFAQGSSETDSKPEEVESEEIIDNIVDDSAKTEDEILEEELKEFSFENMFSEVESDSEEDTPGIYEYSESNYTDSEPSEEEIENLVSEYE